MYLALLYYLIWSFTFLIFNINFTNENICYWFLCFGLCSAPSWPTLSNILKSQIERCTANETILPAIICFNFLIFLEVKVLCIWCVCLPACLSSRRQYLCLMFYASPFGYAYASRVLFCLMICGDKCCGNLLLFERLLLIALDKPFRIMPYHPAVGLSVYSTFNTHRECHYTTALSDAQIRISPKTSFSVHIMPERVHCKA